jgi:hypothetical protein
MTTPTLRRDHSKICPEGYSLGKIDQLVMDGRSEWITFEVVWVEECRETGLYNTELVQQIFLYSGIY